ncbi:discoidin domain-containing protein [Paenibacillus sp. MBLB4367]|uniref:discoidin domain-containing protein n=1 Tax=Paenibacillus sp. MBLB4367 TaxID=3384767 RepID=UPI0039081081
MKRKTNVTYASRLLLCFVMAIGLILSRSQPASAISSKTEPDIIVASGIPGTSNTYFPSMERLADGTLFVVYYSASAHEATNGKIMKTVSADNGQTWSTSVTIIDTLEDDRDPSVMQMNDGTLLVSWFTFNNTTTARQVRTARSTDGGATWSSPVTVGTSLASYSAVTSKAVELSNGDLLLPIYGTIVNRQEMPRSTAVRSTDGGLTWNASTEVLLAEPIPAQNIGFVEPVIVDLGSGHLYSLHRTLREYDNYHAWESHSYDNGFTWTQAARTSMKAHCSDLLLLSGGLLLHTWGDRSFAFSGGRPVVGKAIPVGDDWDDWQTVGIYKNGSVGDMSYPSAVELPDGTIFIVYYDASRGFIGGTYATVEELSKQDPHDRLDLMSLYASGAVQIDTDLTWTTASHPVTGITGAIDGSFSYWNSSFRGSKAPPAAHYELSFQDPVTIRAVGINMRPDYTMSGTVSYSNDGTSWTTLRTYTNVVQNSGEFDMIEPTAPVTAKHVRVEITSSSQWAGLTEIALFGTLQPPSPGTKIDLLSLYNANQLQIDTDMTYTASSRPGLGVTGAIDGNSSYWYSSTRNSSAPPSAHYTVSLGSTKQLKAVGVNLKPGYAEDAVVSVSADGTTWIPVATYSDAVHQDGTIDITRFAAPMAAAYVKVEITKSAGWALLNELELYEAS